MAPGSMTAGQQAMSGVAMPPSWSNTLYFRNGVLLALAQGASTVA